MVTIHLIDAPEGTRYWLVQLIAYHPDPGALYATPFLRYYPAYNRVDVAKIDLNRAPLREAVAGPNWPIDIYLGTPGVLSYGNIPFFIVEFFSAAARTNKMQQKMGFLQNVVLQDGAEYNFSWLNNSLEMIKPPPGPPNERQRSERKLWIPIAAIFSTMGLILLASRRKSK